MVFRQLTFREWEQVHHVVEATQLRDEDPEESVRDRTEMLLARAIWELEKVIRRARLLRLLRRNRRRHAGG